MSKRELEYQSSKFNIGSLTELLEHGKPNAGSLSTQDTPWNFISLSKQNCVLTLLSALPKGKRIIRWTHESPSNPSGNPLAGEIRLLQAIFSVIALVMIYSVLPNLQVTNAQLIFNLEVRRAFFLVPTLTLSSSARLGMTLHKTLFTIVFCCAWCLLLSTLSLSAAFCFGYSK